MKIAVITFWSILAVLASAGRRCAGAPTAEPAAAAKEQRGTREAGSLRFRRVYVPEGTTDWPKGNAKYLPMDAAEFDRLLGTVQRTAPGLPAQSAAGLVHAEYECRMKGQSVLQGSGTLEVSSAIPSSTFLTLDPCNLAIDRARWITSDGAPAVMGMSGDGGTGHPRSGSAAGSMQLLAERAGQMKFDWSLAGQSEAGDGVTFAISLPPCPASRLRIELPPNLLPAVDRGVVALVDRAAPAEPESRCWNIELGGSSGCRLRLAVAPAQKGRGSEEGVPTRSEGPRQVLLADQSAVYDISLRGVDVAVDVRIDPHGGSLRKLLLDLDPRLELAGVEAGGLTLSWNPAPQSHLKRRQAIVELPPALQEGPLSLRIRAVAPLPAGEPWKLPHLFVEGAVCRTNRVRLAVSAPLCVASLAAQGCRQTAVGPLKSANGEQLDFEAWDPDASLLLSVVRRPSEIQAVCAATTEIGQGKMNSRVVADFRASEGSEYEVAADVLPYWAIDSVTSQPADAVDDWAVSGAPARRSGGARRLVVRLAHPLTPARPLRLIVAARRLFAASGRNQDVELAIDDVAPLRFSMPVASRRLIDLRAVGSNELRVAGGDRPWRADVKELTPAELDVCGYAQGDVLLRDETGASALRLSLTSRGPAYAADIRLDAVLAKGTLEESYRFLCTPAAAKPIDRLVVHFSGRREAPLIWSVDGLDDTRYTARRWTAAQELAAGLTADEESWDLTFANRPTTPVEVRAVRRTKLAGPQPLCLASLPDAAEQQAEVVVRSLGPQAVRIATHRVTPVPTEHVPFGRIQTAREAFRYDARAETTPQAEPAIVVTAVDRAAPPAWVWDSEIRSRIAADGTAEHLMTYEIENAGARQIVLKLPPPLRCGDVHDVSINGKLSVATPVDAAGVELPIDLPADARFVALALRIAARGEPLATFQRLQPPMVDIGVPVFSQRWTIELPPDYTTLNAGESAEGAAGSYNVRRRLLGDFARGNAQKVFDPFRGGDWRGLLPGHPRSGSAREEQSRDVQAEAHFPRPADDSGAFGASTSDWPRDDIDRGDGTPVQQGPAAVVVMHRLSLDAAGWLLFLAIVGLGAWPRTGRPAVLVLLAVVCGTCALLLPAVLAAVFSFGLWGIAYCLVLKAVRRVSPPAPAGTPGTRKSADQLPGAGSASTLTNVVPYAAPVLAGVLLLCQSASVTAAEAPADTGAPAHQAPAYSVFIPVDDKQHPTGGKYLVPEAFYSELYRRALLRGEKPQGWMISSAVYRAALAEDGAAAQQGPAVEHVVDQLTADYEVRVFNTAARVRIPLRRDEVSLVPDQARLDERPVQPEWEADGSALSLDIAEPGEYRLNLTLRPKPRSEAGHPLAPGGFEMTIPRIPDARLEFTVPAGGPAVTVPSALGAVHWEEIPSRWIAELGPAERLAVRWHDGTSDAIEALEVQQLQWLKIEPGCVLVYVRLKAKSPTGPVRRLQVKADASLELLPDAKIDVRQVSVPGGTATQTLDVPLRATTAGEAVADLHFLCAGAASVGTFRAPQIEVVGAPPGRRWIAISIDPALDYQLPGGRPPDPAAVPEFLANWGGAPQIAESRMSNVEGGHSTFDIRHSVLPPVAAFRVNGNIADWSITTRVKKTETSGDLRTFWTFDTGVAQLLFDARLATVGGSVFQYRLELPPELRVDSLAITRDGAAVPSRWLRNQDGLLTVFLGDPAPGVNALLPGAPATGRQRLQLHGQLPLPVKGTIALPQVRLDDVHVQNSVVRLYRREQVAIEVLAPPGLAEIRAQEDEAGRDELGLPIRAFYLGAPAQQGLAAEAAVSVKVQPSVQRPHAQAQPPQITPQGRGARIALADVRFACQSDRCVGEAALEVESPIAAEYPIEVPAGFELVCLTVDGVPVDVAPAPDGKRNVMLPGSAGRTRVELLLCAAAAGSPGSAGAAGHPRSGVRATFHAPRLGNLPVENMVWTIAAPAGLQSGQAEADGGPCCAVAPVAPAAADEGAPAQHGPSAGLVAQWQKLAQRCGGAISYEFKRRVDELTVNFTATSSPAWRAPLASVAGFLAAIAGAVVLLRGGLASWLGGRPHLCGVAVGIAWWLWASPSALGPAIVLAVLLHQLARRRWFFRRPASGFPAGGGA